MLRDELVEIRVQVYFVDLSRLYIDLLDEVQPVQLLILLRPTRNEFDDIVLQACHGALVAHIGVHFLDLERLVVDDLELHITRDCPLHLGLRHLVLHIFTEGQIEDSLGLVLQSVCQTYQVGHQLDPKALKDALRLLLPYHFSPVRLLPRETRRHVQGVL